MSDDHTVTWRDRTVGYLGPVATCITQAWLATHRGRQHSLILGGHRLSILACWDTKGRERVPHDDEEVEALRRIVYGRDRPVNDNPPFHESVDADEIADLKAKVRAVLDLRGSVDCRPLVSNLQARELLERIACESCEGDCRQAVGSTHQSYSGRDPESGDSPTEPRA